MTQQTEANSTFSRAVDQLEGIGRWWTDYGRTVGKAALDQGVFALRSSATFLEELSAKLGAPETAVDPEPETEAETQAEAE